MSEELHKAPLNGDDKLVTLANLAKYNHMVCEKLGLGQDNLGYAAPNGNADNVKEALDELYGKVDAISGGSATNTLATISIESGTAKPSLEMRLTDKIDETELNNSAIATKEYVDAKADGVDVEYSFSGETVEFNGGENNIYSLEIQLAKKVGKDGSPTRADTITLTFDASDFVKDGILDKVELLEKAEDLPEGNTYSGDYPALRFTFVTGIDSGKTDIIVSVKSLVDVYTPGNGLTTTEGNDHQFEVKAGSYISVNEDGVGVDTSQLEGYSAVAGEETNNKIATKKYVDDNKISVEDGANIMTDAASQKSGNGIYVTVSGNTFTVGAVVATDTEIEGIFGTHA